jgi:hypothetical protein
LSHSTDLATGFATHPNQITAELNKRLRDMLGSQTPAAKFNDLLAMTGGELEVALSTEELGCTETSSGVFEQQF